MTQNRRYPEGLERDIERTVRQMAERGEAMSLGVAELRGTGRRRDIEDAPVPVSAWVRHRVVLDEPRRVAGEVIAYAYTDTACLVRYRDSACLQHHAWVYAGAVRRT